MLSRKISGSTTFFSFALCIDSRPVKAIIDRP